MIKSKYFPNKTFSTKSEFFKALKDSKKSLEEAKRAAVKHSDGTVCNVTRKVLNNKGEAVKAVTSFELDPAKSYHVINTTNLMDSHDDVHVNGLWDNSVVDEKGNTFFVVDHKLSVLTMIGHCKDIEMKVITMTWKELGFDYDGSTQALVFIIDKSDVMIDQALKIIESNKEIEHSIRMSYVILELAINDSGEGFTEEKAVWDETIGLIANKNEAIEQGYFWRVSEAKIIKEGSMVLFGSNSGTPILTDEEKTEADKQEEEIKAKTAKNHYKFII